MRVVFWTSDTAGRRPVSARRARWLPLVTAGLLLGLGACSDTQKKLSSGSPSDVLLYEVLQQERPTSYYYGVVRDSHDPDRFCYRCTDDPYLVDKSIDAVTQLGDAPYARLEGQAVVVGKLAEVLLEDPSVLAQASAANSLTKIAAKLPDYPQRGPEDGGARVIQLLQAMDGLHDENGARRPGAAASQQLGQIVTQLGDLRISDMLLAKESLRPFHNRAYLVDETDPQLRAAIDTALTKRLRAVIRVGLISAVPSSSEWVRADAVRGLKTLGETEGLTPVLQQLEIESHWQVRAEMVEYLGRVGGASAVAALLPLLDDSDPSVRHKSRTALTRIAGQDLGRRQRAWRRWAERRYPSLAEGAAPLDDETELPELGPDLPGPVGPAPGTGTRTPGAPVPGTVAPRPLPPSSTGPISDVPQPSRGVDGLPPFRHVGSPRPPAPPTQPLPPVSMPRQPAPLRPGPGAVTQPLPPQALPPQAMPQPRAPVPSRPAVLPDPVVRAPGGARIVSGPRTVPGTTYRPGSTGAPATYSGNRPPPPPMPTTGGVGAQPQPGVRYTRPIRNVPPPPPPPSRMPRR